LAFSLLAIMTRLLDWDINISIFIISISINVHVNVTIGPNNGFSASLDIGLKLGLGLGKEWDEGLDVPSIKYCCLLSTYHVAWPFVVLRCAKIWSLYNTNIFAPSSFDLQFFSGNSRPIFEALLFKFKIQKLYLIKLAHIFQSW